jgi:hypothetical protein
MGEEIIQYLVRPTVVPVITAGAYVADDALGGKMQFLRASRSHDTNNVGPKTGLIHGFQVVDEAKQNAEIDVYLFDQDFTPTADNAPFDPSAADLKNCFAVIHVQAADYVVAANRNIATEPGLSVPMVLQGNILYAQAVVRTAPTYVSVGDLRFTFTIFQD